MAARDRLFQIDLWRRTGTGKLAEILGPEAVARDRLARAVRFRGDWNAEWAGYGADTREIVTAFVAGINAFIASLEGQRPVEFKLAGYDPEPWAPEDCLARVAGLLMTRNVTREVARAADARRFGLELLSRIAPPDPPVPLEIPKGLDLADISPAILRTYSQVTGSVAFPGQGSNNWVVDGTLTATGKPLLANDPHRPVQIPSLRKTVHLVAPGWNAIGAGEPALPGIALGHNDRVAFGFTIVGIDQQDLYVEKLNPANPGQYRYRGAWRNVEVEHQTIKVRGTAPQTVELRYTLHGPIIHEDRARSRAYALKWVGSEPGTAGYLAALALARARDWKEFLAATERYKVPGENLVYADVDGNIGWQAAGLTPVRKNWSGLFPVPGDTGEYEWSGFRALDELPRAYNPPEHMIATANHNILPPGYTLPLAYEWTLPFRYLRIREMLAGARKFSVADFQRMQQDVVSLPARRFQAVLKKWERPPEAAREVLAWDGAMIAGSRAALIYEVWMRRLPAALFGEAGARADLRVVLERLERAPEWKALAASLEAALAEIKTLLGADRAAWRWGNLHRIYFRHPLNRPEFHRGPVERPGDAYTVNATSGAAYAQSSGASYRQVIDLAEWDRSVMTNVPGESGDPTARHYADLLEEWGEGRYHPMLFSRARVEAATRERIMLIPSATSAIAKPAAASTR